MNKKLLYTALFLAVMATGCKKEEPTQDTERTPVSLQIETDVTRVVTNNGKTEFVEGDIISVTSSGLEADMSNSQFTVTADGTLTGDVFYYDGSKSATFYAHYPHTAVCNDGAVTMTVNADQTTAERYNESDFMTSIATGDPKYGGGVRISMSHRLTLVKIIWKGSLYASEATLHNLARRVTWVQADNSLKLEDGLTDILTWKIAPDKQEYWAVVPAQTIRQGSHLLTIVDADMEYKYVAETDVTLNPNTIKKITLDVKSSGAVTAIFNELEVDDWVADNIVCDGVVDEYETDPIELVSEEAGKYITLTKVAKKANAEPGKWNYVTTEGNLIELIQEENEPSVIHMNIKSNKVDDKEKSTWWDNAVYFRPDARTAAKIRPVIYELSFEYKVSGVQKGAMVQVMKGDEVKNTYFGIINQSPFDKDGKLKDITYSKTYYPTLKESETDKVDSYQKLTYWVNFGTIYRSDIKVDPATGETVKDVNGKEVEIGWVPSVVGDYENVLLTLTVNVSNAYGSDFHFRNFKFVQVK